MPTMQPVKPPGPQIPQSPLLLSLGCRDTTRLLEVYVKRSLSVNDGPRTPRARPAKWKTVTQRVHFGAARSHSDGSDRPVMGGGLGAVGRMLSTVDSFPTEGLTDQPLAAAEAERSQGPREEKKTPALKRFLGLFSRKSGEEEKEARDPSADRRPTSLPACLPASESPVVGDQSFLRPRRSVGRKPSFLKLPFHGRGSDRNQAQRTPSFKILSATSPPAAVMRVEPTGAYYEKVSEELERIVKEVKDSPMDESQPTFAESIQNGAALVAAEAVMRVEPTGAYYEKVSEELERIVKEVKDSPMDESQPTFAESIQNGAALVAAEEGQTIEKIIGLLKQQGDAIDVKIKQSTSVSSFFQSLSYSSFRQLADRYVEEEVPSTLPEATPAPELVKFAFTLDFTAKLAGLSNQAVSRIMGFGNQYLQDRFTQMSKDLVPAHRQSFMEPD